MLVLSFDCICSYCVCEATSIPSSCDRALADVGATLMWSAARLAWLQGLSSKFSNTMHGAWHKARVGSKAAGCAQCVWAMRFV